MSIKGSDEYSEKGDSGKIIYRSSDPPNNIVQK